MTPEALSVALQVVSAIRYAVTYTPIVAELTPVAVHAAPVAGSVVSTRYIHPNDVPSATEPLSTVVAPLLSCTAPERAPASDLLTKPRVVTATVLVGVTPSAAML